MLKVAIIGLGNTGNQVALLASEKTDIPVLAINSSEKDLETVRDKIPYRLLKSSSGTSEGAGKNRMLAKKYLKESIMEIISDRTIQEKIADQHVVFIVSSTGGGTGSGTSLLMYSILQKTFPDTLFIIVGVLPVLSEAMSAHVNSMEYWNELYKCPDAVYMQYDNNQYADLPNYQILKRVNFEIVKDIMVIRGQYNYTTPYDSIDEEDMRRLISCPGRLMVVRVEDIKERSINTTTVEEMLIQGIKTSAHVEIERDLRVVSTGVVANISDTIAIDFDTHIESVRNFIGVPDHDFIHLVIGERNTPNNVYLIMSGLSPINSRIEQAKDRIAQIEERQAQCAAETSVVTSLDVSSMSNRASSRDGSSRKSDSNTTGSTLDLKDIFAEFGLSD